MSRATADIIPLHPTHEDATVTAPKTAPTQTLSPDQDAACRAIMAALEPTDPPAGAGEPIEASLSGPAGSGKTFLMRHVIATMRDHGWSVALLAPTGKAALRLAEATGQNTSTIHSALYGRVDSADDITEEESAAWRDLCTQADVEGTPRPPALRAWVKAKRREAGGRIEQNLSFGERKDIGGAGRVFVIDEASMVGSRLATDLRAACRTGTRLLWVGDKEQLQPVKDTWGADLDRATATLTQVHRQAAGSPIIGLATAIRNGQPWEKVEPVAPYYRGGLDMDKVGGWVASMVEKGRDFVALTFTNKTRRRVNRIARERLGLADKDITEGERVVVTLNHKDSGLRNGEVLTIDKLSTSTTSWGVERYYATFKERPEGDPVRIDPDCIRHDAKPESRKVLSLSYGYCLSVHKSQGSQWHTVGVVYDFSWFRRKNPDSYRRLCYTAVTRASARLFIFDL